MDSGIQPGQTGSRNQQIDGRMTVVAGGGGIIAQVTKTSLRE
jgi:hypothetical protein